MRYYLLIFLFIPQYGGAQTVSEFQEVITYLASDELQGRQTASQGIYKAQQFLAKELRTCGLDPRYQELMTPRGKCRNLVAWLQGASKDYIVVGAHLDHIGSRRHVMNGADDNASGSAVTLALAKKFRNKERNSISPLPYSIIFVWFTGEEHGFWGSEYFVKHPILQGLPFFMLNLDMVGRLQTGDMQADPFDNAFTDLMVRYPFAKGIMFRDGSRSSDQYPFYRKGVPVVMLHTGLHSDYHKFTDDAERINYKGLVQVYDLAFDLLWTVLHSPDYNLIESI